MRPLLALWLMLAATPLLAQTQSEMNQQAAEDLAKANRKLNAVYAEVRATLDAEAQAKLKVAQRAWLAFRDAEADFQGDAGARGGTMQPLIVNEVRQRLTETRTKDLQALLDQQAEH
ncbi:MAG TPA: lysozyme inhibitor LprI family protein [Chthoniobacterales bacterium]|jgi:uncharacterized protein YecT (DUF1311 family)